jgi:hypothetical protein
MQDWTRFPVTGISVEDAQAYAAWLDRTRRVPGARLCTRPRVGARGARRGRPRDTRRACCRRRGEANVTDTYGGIESVGVDEVGSYPATRSPFGLDDIVGKRGGVVRARRRRTRTQWIRSMYHYPVYRAVTAREPAAATFAMPRLGLRICAGLTPLEAHAGR